MNTEEEITGEPQPHGPGVAPIRVSLGEALQISFQAEGV